MRVIESTFSLRLVDRDACPQRMRPNARFRFYYSLFALGQWRSEGCPLFSHSYDIPMRQCKFVIRAPNGTVEIEDNFPIDPQSVSLTTKGSITSCDTDVLINY
jgi:hypothetical protein